MLFRSKAFRVALVVIFTFAAIVHVSNAENEQAIRITTEGENPEESSDPVGEDAIDEMSLAELKTTGYQRSRFKELRDSDFESTDELKPQADLEAFEQSVKPLLEEFCFDCHGYGEDEGNIQLDKLNPDLLQGSDTEWWEEVFGVVTKEEMPPRDYAEMDEADRRVVVDWLSAELQSASLLKRQSGTRSRFRRLTRYEYNYALQDLLGQPWNFAKDLPPDPTSEAGFRNSSELLHLSVSQFETYHRLAREALERVIVTGNQPQTLYWGVSMRDAAEREWQQQRAQLEKVEAKFADNPDKLQAELDKLEESFRRSHPTAYYKDLTNNRTAAATWAYSGARYAFPPTETKPSIPKSSDCVAILPAGRSQNLVVELGNRLPDEGTMRVTVRASRTDENNPKIPSLQLLFGWQASNEGRALLRVGEQYVPVTATQSEPQLIQWDVELSEIYPRNSVRKTSKMGSTPSPSEYIRIANSSASSVDVQIDWVMVEAPVYDQWPPQAHRQILGNANQLESERVNAEQVLQQFMTRAWRRPPSTEEVERKLKLFAAMRAQSDSFEGAMLEVLATVLSSPQFLFVGQRALIAESSPATTGESRQLANKKEAYELATELSLFLWSSIPDEELLQLAISGQLLNKEVLADQIERMLADPKSDRLSENFVQQWLNLELLEFVNFKQHVPGFDPLLKESMQHEPIAMFAEMLKQDASVLDFIHADYGLVDERLARHYGIRGVTGNHFRRVTLDKPIRRGGLLTQAGVLAMNSDWPDSHPLKRAIWLLECLLDDPPPPPPPAVPQIDLADPEIAKMTLKERIEDHRNHAACNSCHTRIDPWGIAFENYDALGKWRDELSGKPIDATSRLFNQQTLEGIEGLKRYLLASRQDQFVQAMVTKLAGYALGRPIGFEDRAEIERITAHVRSEGDGLKTIIHAIVQSQLFQAQLVIQD